MKMMHMPYLDIWSMLLSGYVPHRTNSSQLLWMGYSRKKNWGVGWLGHKFLKKPLEVFLFFFVPLEISGQVKLYPWKFGKIMNVISLANFKTKDQDPWKFHMNFSWSSLEIRCCFYSWKFCRLFLGYPLKFYIYPQTPFPLFGFFSRIVESQTQCLVQTLSHKNEKNLPPITGWLSP